MSAPGSATALLDDIAEGLWRRLRDAALAERQLGRFAFTDEAAGATPARLAALAADAGAVTALARDLTLRAVVAAADNYRLLAGLGEEPAAIATIAGALGLPSLAVTERVGALAQLGLVARDLERDAVAGTRGGRGLVAVLDVIADAVAARCRGGLAEIS
jgi:hypothetical protein